MISEAEIKLITPCPFLSQNPVGSILVILFERCIFYVFILSGIEKWKWYELLLFCCPIVHSSFEHPRGDLVVNGGSKNHEASGSNPSSRGKNTKRFLPICPNLGGPSYPVPVLVGGSKCLQN